ncbi:heparinase II/III family protein [Lactobacillus pasteurii]|uniref:Heparinase II/III-like protein n=1 Tax=Lactobacillus pasteurii DSM 23907 = CRBIP 24.76 TaxID=1423790 RepID=I7JXD3_9LACO|nr:heparinase II/III family protein [Lactobacillus pasteurii]TDG77441.1 hypothetical protein C5L33_000884 [Lactobacillus pasteurii]CCI84515.1 Heparinase II/III-like protein [Lactobacillus pasteurii DSM 23907 = CRBIP 24.76]
MINLIHLKQQIDHRISLLNPDSYSTLIPKDEQSKFISEANLLLNHDFKFDRRWDMERCTKIYHLDQLNFETIKNDDPEWNFMLNRMDWLNYLFLAGVLTNNSKYFVKAKELILTWINQHPIIINQNSTRTLDTGIRLVNWINCLTYLSWSNQITDAELEKISSSIEKQILYLKENYVPKYQLSNWGSIQVCGILITLPFIYKDFENNDLYQWALNELKLQLNLQVLDDGMDWEQSPMYHVELLLALQHLLFFKPNKIIENLVLPIIKKMSNTLQQIVTPKKLLPNFGDSDQVSPNDILANSAYLLKDEQINYFGEFSYEDLIYIGQNFLEYKKIGKRKPTNLNYLGFSSGNFALRSNWQIDSNYLFFNNGSMGSGHAHSDNLHLSIYGKGEPIFVDSGRYTYREDHPTRILLKSMQAHNSVLIDNYEPAKPNSSWDFDSYYKVLPTFYNTKESIHYLEGSVVGNNPLEIWTRKVIMLECGVWIISDEVSISGNHEINQLWHLYPSTDYNDDIIKTPNSSWKFIHSESIELTDFPFSPKYNEIEQSKMITLKKSFTDNVSLSTILASTDLKIEKIPILQNFDRPVKEETAEGWKIITPSHEYCIAIFHQEVFTGKKIFSIDDTPFHHQAFATIDHTPLALKN